MPNENTIEIINQNYIIEIDTPQYSIFTENTLNIDYNYATKKPQINSVELSGNKSTKDLGLVDFSDIETKENISNKVTVLDENSTDIEYPSAKCVNDLLLVKVDVDLSNLSEQGQAKFDEKANKDFNNVVEIAEGSLLDNELKNKLNKQQITNCLLEVPQRIKYTLNYGTLTIKAGSVVIVPYGTEDLTETYPVGSTFLNDNFKVYDTQFVDGKFFVWAELQEDKSHNSSYTQTNLPLALRISDGNIILSATSVSGTVTPQASSSYTLFYNTTENKCYNDAGNWVQATFPLMIVNRQDGIGISNVRNVFNGMGYIGSTWWLENLEGLGANGYNADGTYKNVQHKLNEIVLQTIGASFTISNMVGAFDVDNLIGAAPFEEVDSIPTGYTTTWLLNKIDNRIYEWTGSSYNLKTPSIIPACTFDVTNGVISNFQSKQPFRAVDYSDSSTVSGWAMPSDKYIDLTLGASGSIYTAPANGWFTIVVDVAAGGNLQVGENFYQSSTIAGYVGGITPVRKGQQIWVSFSKYQATIFSKFYYAEGEV